MPYNTLPLGDKSSFRLQTFLILRIIHDILYTHINCKDARDLDILVFFLGFFGFLGFCFLFYVLGFGFFGLGVFRFFRFFKFFGGFCFGVFWFWFWFLFLFICSCLVLVFFVIFWFWLLLHIVLNFSLKLCTTWWWPLWPKHVVVSYLPTYSYILIII